MTLRVDAERLTRSRYALSRLTELSSGLEVLTHPERAPYARSWVQRTRRQLDLKAMSALFALVEHDSWYVPDLLVPIPQSYEPDLEEELAGVAAAPPATVEYELRLAFRIGEPSQLVRERGAGGTGRDPRAPLPPVIADLLDRGGPEALLERIVAQLRYCWRQTLAEPWTLLRRVLDEDIRHRAVLASRLGLAEIVTGLDPRITWDGERMLVRSPVDVSLEPEPGLILIPSVFLHRPAVWQDHGGQIMLGYPARGRGQVWAGPGLVPGSANVLGPRRAALLADLRTPRTTTELAERHRLSPATISYHLGRLHTAGLVERRRSGQSVRYERTGLAADLLNAGQAEQRQYRRPA